MSVNHKMELLGLNMTALYEVCDPLEDVGHLSHHSEPLLHQGQELLVFFRGGTLLIYWHFIGISSEWATLIGRDPRDPVLWLVEPYYAVANGDILFQRP